MKSFKRRPSKNVKFWNDHVDALVATGAVRKGSLRLLLDLIRPGNIGFGQGQVRPGKLGQWDVYYALAGAVRPSEQVVLAGLSVEEIAEAQWCSFLRQSGVDPDNQKEVEEFSRIRQMTREAVNRDLENSPRILVEIDPDLERQERDLADFDPAES